LKSPRDRFEASPRGVGRLGAEDQKGHDPRESEQAGNDAAGDCSPIGVAHFGQPRLAQANFLAPHRRDIGANLVHLLFAAIALNNRKSRGLPSILMQIKVCLSSASLASTRCFRAASCAGLTSFVATIRRFAAAADRRLRPISANKAPENRSDR
jgi:hypothetical protein